MSFITKSISSKVSLLVVLVLIIVTVSSSFISNSRLKQSEMEKLDMIHRTIELSLDTLKPEVEQILSKSKAGTLDVENDEDLKKVEAVLTSTTASNFAGSVYMLYPDTFTEEMDDGTHTFTKFIAVGDSLKEYGYASHKDFDLPQIFVDAMEEVKVQKDENTIIKTVAYNDGDGDWVSTLSQYYDSKGNYVADFCIDFSLEDIENTLSNNRTQTLLIAALVTIIAGVLMWAVVRFMLKPVKSLQESIEKASTGDFSEHIDIKSKDEFGVLSQSFNNMQTSLQELIGRVRESSSRSVESSLTVRTNAETSMDKSQEVYNNASQITDSMKAQVHSTSETKTAIEEIVVAIGKVSDSAYTLSDQIVTVSNNTEESAQLVNDAVVSIESVSESVEELYSLLKVMEENSSDISSILTAISEVAQQTNLLSLNASIEAARAGEHGRGFAVVASEIRTLSETSKKSSDQIGLIIDKMVGQVKSASESITDTINKVQDSVSVIRNTDTNIQNIRRETLEVSQEIQEVSAAAEQLSAGSEEILSAVDELSKLAVHIDSVSSGIKTTAEVQLKASQELLTCSSDMIESSKEVSTEVNKFTIEGKSSNVESN